MLDKLFQWNGWSFKIGPISITFSITGIIEVLIFIVLIYYLIRWFQRTKAWNLLKGLLVLGGLYALAAILGLNNLTYLFNILFSSILLAVIVIFQPEIRRALEKLGTNNIIYKLLPGLRGKDETSDLSTDSIEAIVHALASMGRNHVGALVVIERKIMLERQREGIALAKAQGKYRGRREAKKPADWQELVTKYKCREISTVSELVRICGCSRPTVYKWLKSSGINIKEKPVQLRKNCIAK